MMARFHEPSPEQEATWKAWVASRPEGVRRIAERLDPWTLYVLKPTGQRVTLYSIVEDGTVTVNVTGDYNAVLFERRVYGINPDNLSPCALPASTACLGTVMTAEDVDNNLDALRVAIRPDLWVMDEDGHARRRP